MMELINNVDETLKAIKEFTSEHLPETHIPKLVKLYDKPLLVALSGKLNVAKMEKDTHNLINI